MTHSLALDTLAYAKRLKQAGFTEQQAEVQAETLAEIIDDKLANKQDLKELETSLKRDMKELELRLKHDLTVRFGVMLAAGLTLNIGIIAALIKLL